jgi:anti-anti-sigma factor
MPPVTQSRTMPLLVVRVCEPLDATRIPSVDGLLDDAVAVRPAHLVVDLSECEYLDAAGITLLLDVHKRIWADGGRMTLRGISPRLGRILELARVGRVFGTTTGARGDLPGNGRSAAQP